ncbi:MAG TPA: helix-hairpin-helix domain-containing protein [bacterium]|jgi:competence ComEA-like helix-hairpin-helix protein
MIGNFGFRPRTMLWLLGIAFAAGLGTRVVQEIRHKPVQYPLTVVENDVAAQDLKRRADSIMAARFAAQNAPIDINTATATDFERLDGIGPVLAARMVQYREQHGHFASVDQLDDVPGIGPKRLAAIRDKCIVGTEENRK